jgi:hypothetical protein
MRKKDLNHGGSIIRDTDQPTEGKEFDKKTFL